MSEINSDKLSLENLAVQFCSDRLKLQIRILIFERDELKEENKKLKEVLSEAHDWLCPHEEQAIKAMRAGARGWCTHCSNYLRSEKDATLSYRINQALKGEK